MLKILSDVEALTIEIRTAGDYVRHLKAAQPGDSEAIAAAVAALLEAKAAYTAATGQPYDLPKGKSKKKSVAAAVSSHGSERQDVDITRQTATVSVNDPAWSLVNNTALDALAAKASAAQLGYYGEARQHSNCCWDRVMLKALRNPASSSSSDKPGKVRPQTPLVHHSYFVRTTAVEVIVRRWAAATEPEERAGTMIGPKKRPRRRVIVVGAGLDTLPLRLMEAWQQQRQPASSTNACSSSNEEAADGASIEADPLAKARHDDIVFIEVDAEAVLRAKQSVFESNPQFSSALLGDGPHVGCNTNGSSADSSSSSHGNKCEFEVENHWHWRSSNGRLSLVAADLASVGSLERSLSRADATAKPATKYFAATPGEQPVVVDNDAETNEASVTHTLIMIECVLSYLPAPAADALLNWAASLADSPRTCATQTTTTAAKSGKEPSSTSSLVLFEPVPGYGAVGRCLHSHFHARAVPLLAHNEGPHAPEVLSTSSLPPAAAEDTSEHPNTVTASRSVLLQPAARGRPAHWPAVGAAGLAAAVAASGWESSLLDNDSDSEEASISKTRAIHCAGFVEGVDLNVAAGRWVPPFMRRRAFACEPFDEMAALHALQSQYAMVVATRASAAVVDDGDRADEKPDVATRAAKALMAAMAAPTSHSEEEVLQQEQEAQQQQQQQQQQLEQEEVDGRTKESVEIGLLEACDATAAAALAVEVHASLAQSLPAVRRFWKHALKKDLADPFAYYSGISMSSIESSSPNDNSPEAWPLRRLWVARTVPQGQVVGCVAIDEDPVIPSPNPDTSTAEPPTRPLDTESGATPSLPCVTIELKRLAMHPAYRRRGLGKQLVETALKYARGAAAKMQGMVEIASTTAAASPVLKVRLTCLSGAAVPEAAAACALYSGLGFVMVREHSSGPCGPSRSDEKRAIMCDFELCIGPP